MASTDKIGSAGYPAEFLTCVDITAVRVCGVLTNFGKASVGRNASVTLDTMRESVSTLRLHGRCMPISLLQDPVLHRVCIQVGQERSET